MNPACPPWLTNSARSHGEPATSARGSECGGDERIVLRVDEQAGTPDPRQERPAARAGPVVALVREAVSGAVTRAVVLGERAGAPERARQVHARRELSGLRPHLAPSWCEGSGRCRGSARRRGRATAAHAARSKGMEMADGPAHLRRARGPPARRATSGPRCRPARPDEGERRSGITLDETLHEPVEVRGLSGMVEARLTVQLAAARAEVEDDAPPAERADLVQEPEDVVGAASPSSPCRTSTSGAVAGASSQSRSTKSPSGVSPALASQRNVGGAAEERPPEGLERAARGTTTVVGRWAPRASRPRYS